MHNFLLELDFLDIRLLFLNLLHSLLVIEMLHDPSELEILLVFEYFFSFLLEMLLPFIRIKSCFKMSLSNFEQFFQFCLIFHSFFLFALLDEVIYMALLLKFIKLFFLNFILQILVSVSDVVEWLWLFWGVFHCISLNCSH